MILLKTISYDNNPAYLIANFRDFFRISKKSIDAFMSKTYNDNWSDSLKKLATERDLQAFRELFDYFGPRIKSFLFLRILLCFDAHATILLLYALEL